MKKIDLNVGRTFLCYRLVGFHPFEVACVLLPLKRLERRILQFQQRLKYETSKFGDNPLH